MRHQDGINQKIIDKVLGTPFWPPDLETQKAYVTTHDDNDGDPLSGLLQVTFTIDGDAWISIQSERGSTKALRFRTWGGGGKYLKIRNALLLLADAIRQEGSLK